MVYSNLIEYLKSVNCRYSLNELLKEHTTMKVGGPADIYVEADSVGVLSGILSMAKNEGIPIFLIGNGSNLVVSDSGYRGIIVKLSGDFTKICVEDNDIISCGAGSKLIDACKFALENSLSGLEFAYGIPGSCGGAVYMNAGAYGGEIKDVLIKAECINYDSEKKVILNNEFRFEYRKSLLSSERTIITNVYFKLCKSNFEDVKAKMNNIMCKRVAKQPLDFPSAGSMFKRPKGCYVGPMIEKCGLKGFSIGGAKVSEKHAGFVINKGGATCEGILKLVDIIKGEVKSKFGVDLETEPLFLSS